MTEAVRMWYLPPSSCTSSSWGCVGRVCGMVEAEGPTRCFLGFRVASGRGRSVDEVGTKSVFVSRRPRFLDIEDNGGTPGDAVMEPVISSRDGGTDDVLKVAVTD